MPAKMASVRDLSAGEAVEDGVSSIAVRDSDTWAVMLGRVRMMRAVWGERVLASWSWVQPAATLMRSLLEMASARSG